MARRDFVARGIQRFESTVVGNDFMRSRGRDHCEPGVGRTFSEGSSHGVLRHCGEIQSCFLDFCRKFVREIDVESSHNTHYAHRGAPLSLLHLVCKESPMDAAARVTSKGQVTVPKSVRDALGIHEGDEIVFRVEGNRAVLARTPDFLSLAGSLAVPAAKRNVAWDDVIRKTRVERADRRR